MAIVWSFSQTGVATALFLVFIYRSSNHLTSVPVLMALLVLVLSAAALRFLPGIIKSDPIQQRSSDSEAVADKKALTEELATFGCDAGIGDEDDHENLSRSSSKCSNFDDDDEEEEEDGCLCSESSTDSISDDNDENLIEISLPDGHLLVRPPPEARVRRHGLVELLQLEINEDENLIEIDIIRGSIKCSRVGGIKG